MQQVRGQWRAQPAVRTEQHQSDLRTGVPLQGTSSQALPVWDLASQLIGVQDVQESGRARQRSVVTDMNQRVRGVQ